MSGVCEYCKVRYAGEVCSSCSYRPEVMAARAAAKAAASATTATATGPSPAAGGQPSAWLPSQAQQSPAAPYPPQPQAYGQQVPAPRPAPQEAPAYGSAKLIGDAQPIAGMPLSRILNALSYVVAGIAMLVISAQPGIPVVTPLFIGFVLVGYGVKIAITRGSYWVSSFVYVLAIGAVLMMFGVLSR